MRDRSHHQRTFSTEEGAGVQASRQLTSKRYGKKRQRKYEQEKRKRTHHLIEEDVLDLDVIEGHTKGKNRGKSALRLQSKKSKAYMAKLEVAGRRK